MKFENIQKVIVSVPLAEYAEGYKAAGDPKLHVWVNVPRATLIKRDELDNEYFLLMAEVEMSKQKFHERLKATKSQNERARLVRNNEKQQQALQTRIEDYTARNYEWFSELWSQGPEATRWPVEDIQTLAESDHMLLGWLADRTRELLATRRVDQKNV